jgi:lipid-A-disaccharide synthase
VALRASDAAPLIVLVAGELSGDNLGAGLIEALRARIPNARFAGIPGPKMRAAGCEAWWQADELAVMGLVEVLPELPRLLRIRRELVERVQREQPIVYVGVDFKEFNLSVAKRLKQAGVRTVQYVSPQVWAWRPGRVHTVARAVDLVLCLLPFEKPFYDARLAKGTLDVRYVGHPLGDQIPMQLDKHVARMELGLDAQRLCVALLPGSRRGEVSRLADDFAATAAWLLNRRADMQFVAPMASDAVKALFAAALERAGMTGKVLLIDGQAQTAMTASDAVLLASGTATLEAALLKRAMVVAYRIGWLTTFLMRDLKLMKAPFFALPNLLANRKLVPEFLNEQVTADVLGPALLEQLERPDREQLHAEFTAMHRALKCDASATAAAAIIELITQRAPVEPPLPYS